jgi:hypothetical protein
MAKFTGKNNFANGDTITFTSLNDITDTLEIATDSFTSTFDVTNGLVSINNGAITTDLLETSTDENTGISTEKIQDDAITTVKLPDSTGTTDGVTYAKMQYVSATAKLLGRTTAASGVVEEVDIDTDLAVVSANNDTIPSAKAVKDYVDSAPNFLPQIVDSADKFTTLPNGLIFKFGEKVPTDPADTQTTITFDTTDVFDTVFSVQVTALKNDTAVSSVSLNSVTVTQAIVNHVAGIDKIYYTAIGE